jgi:predicted ATPase
MKDGAASTVRAMTRAWRHTQDGTFGQRPSWRREDGVVRQLEFDGFSVVEGAATNIIVLEQARGIAEPWKYPTFIVSIVELQRRRHLRESHEPDEVQFHNRSAVCTAALAICSR